MKKVLLLLTACLLTATWSYAADFTIQVPVNLSKIPVEYSKLQVKCWALCASTTDVTSVPSMEGHPAINTIQLAAIKLFDNWDQQYFEYPVPGYVKQLEVNDFRTQIVGAGLTDRPINPLTGEFHETVNVSFDAFRAGGYAPDNVRSYVCGIKISESGPEQWKPESYDQNQLAEIASSVVLDSSNGATSSGSGTGLNTDTYSLIVLGRFNNPAIDPNQTTPECRDLTSNNRTH